MPSFARFLCPDKTARARMVAAGVVIAGAMLAPLGAAQQNSPAQEGQGPAPASPPVLVNPLAPDQLGFMTGYAGRPAKELEKDKAFGRVVKEVVPKTTYHYGRDMSLNLALEDVVDGSKLPVMLRDSRYLMLTGDRGPYLRGRGFLWFDLQTGLALGGFYFTPTNGEPTPTLTIFSKQLDTKALAMSELPDAFVQDLYQWETIERVAPVTPRYFIPVNGKKYVLVHDEDYCWHPANTPAPAQDVCERMNADAADADMNAAYFMTQTHNSANATAWMLRPDQVEWLALRDRSCGLTGLDCRIRMARERTWVLIGGPPRAPRPRPGRGGY